MEINVANQRVLRFVDQLSKTEAIEKANNKKIEAFGTLNLLGSFLNRPSDDDFELVYSEHRYQPFWHVTTKATYAYDRNTQYEIAAKSKEVQSITLKGSDYQVINGHFNLSLTEHCLQNESEVVFVDGITGKSDDKYQQYLSYKHQDITSNPSLTIDKASIMVPPQSRVSAIMRDSLAKMIKGIQADKILEEHVEVSCIDLYYYPIYAFKYRWISKNKEAITEIDALTGSVKAGNRTFNEYLGKMLDVNFLFDVGADAAGMIIPGGSIAVKVAKKYLDHQNRTS